MEDSPPTITVHVKFAGRTIPVVVPASASTAELKLLLQPLTNVLPRGQRLICKGKVLAEAASLSSMQVADGSKVMLIASQGLHQGDGPITKNSSGPAATAKKTSNVKENHTQKQEIISKSRPERWKITGVIALSDSGLKVVPEEVWDCGSSVRVLDVCNNSIETIPQKIAALRSLNKLLVTANNLSDGGICWEGLSCVLTLTVLSLSQNRLVTLPPSLGSLTFLRELRIANNMIGNLPVEIGLLKQLEILIANNNRITSLPYSIGDCESLIEVNLSSNLLAELPEAFGNLHNLKALHIRNNGINSLPSTLFKKCWRLTTLDLHGTGITNDILRQVEGWEEFDERRRQKYQKQLDFRVGSSGVFDEAGGAFHRSLRPHRLFHAVYFHSIMVLVDAAATANANANPKVQDEKKPSEWSLRGLWYGPCRRMPYEFAEVRKMYPNIPAENADLFAGQGLLNKVGRALSFNTCSVVVKTDYKGREVVKRTMLVSGRDVGKLEADVEKLNKKQQ